MHHYAERSLPNWGKNTYVHWAIKPATNALIFIHGFNGSSEDTFADFNILFRSSDAFHAYDIYFFGYDSLFEPTENSALSFREFIGKIYSDSLSLYNYSLPAQEISRPTYKKITIVAHSLGAVVSRIAFIEAHNKKAPWLKLISLILFAPAHKGSSLSLTSIITGEALPGLWKLLSIGAGYFIPTLKEVAGNSVLLKELEAKTMELINKGETGFTIAKKVIWAARERVVISKRFANDPDAEKIPQTTHTTVCKPNIQKLRAFEILVKNL